MARADPSLLRRHDHPTWDLLNRVAAHGMTFDRSDDPALQGFLRFMEAEAKLLTDAPVPSVGLFELALKRVNAEIESQTHASRAASRRSHPGPRAARRGAGRMDRRRARADPAADLVPLSARTRHFLETAWSTSSSRPWPSTARLRCRPDGHGRRRCAAESLKLPRDGIARAALQQRLPCLIHQLEAGCDSIQLAAPRRDAFFQDLMDMHGRVLRGLPAVEVVAAGADARRHRPAADGRA